MVLIQPLEQGSLFRCSGISGAAEPVVESPGQASAGQRAPRHDADALCPGSGEKLLLGVPDKQVIQVFLNGNAKEMALICLFLSDTECLGGEVAGSDIVNESITVKLLKDVPHFLPGYIAVDMVHEIHFDMIRSQTFHGGAEMTADFVCRQAARAVRSVIGIVHFLMNFGGENDFLAPAAALGKPFANDFSVIPSLLVALP